MNNISESLPKYVIYLVLLSVEYLLCTDTVLSAENTEKKTMDNVLVFMDSGEDKKEKR